LKFNGIPFIAELHWALIDVAFSIEARQNVAIAARTAIDMRDEAIELRVSTVNTAKHEYFAELL
jgi:hypothetical protein